MSGAATVVLPNDPDHGVSLVEALRAHVEASHAVEVEDADGSRWRFRVRSVELSLLDQGNEWYARLLAEDAAAFQTKLEYAVRAPSPGAMRAVIVRGAVAPAVSFGRRDDAVWIDDLVRRDLLARRLYAEIMRVSLAGLFSQVSADEPAAPMSTSGETSEHAKPRPPS